MNKYAPLREFLKNISQNTIEVELNFDDIEKIINSILPPSAYKHQAWWSNPKSKSYHRHAQSWLESGWQVTNVDFTKKKVKFRRRGDNEKEAINKALGDKINSTDQHRNKRDQDFPKVKPNEALRLLQEIGFEEVGYWFLHGDEMEFRLEKHEEGQDILYAFVAKDNVKYIGKTVKTLTDRMNRYKHPGRQQATNVKNNKEIRKLLEQGIAVKIFALLPNQETLYRGLPIDLVTGLESKLISVLNPPWNGKPKKNL